MILRDDVLSQLNEEVLGRVQDPPETQIPVAESLNTLHVYHFFGNTKFNPDPNGLNSFQICCR